MEQTHVETGNENQVKSLSHRIRRDIIHLVGEKGGAAFIAIKNSLKINENSSLYIV